MSDTAEGNQEAKRLARERMLEEAKKIRIRKSEAPYAYDNPHLEHKSSWGKKLEQLEEGRYKDKPKIAFHRLDEQGEMKHQQIQRDWWMTTLTWSFIGNFGGVGVVRYIEKKSDSYKSLQHFKKREMMKVGAFLGTIAIFSVYGYANANQHFVRQKLKIVEEHSVESFSK